MFGVPGPGINPNSAAQTAAPLVDGAGQDQARARRDGRGHHEHVPHARPTASSRWSASTSTATGRSRTRTTASACPGAVTTIGGVANNETPNLRVELRRRASRASARRLQSAARRAALAGHRGRPDLQDRRQPRRPRDRRQRRQDPPRDAQVEGIFGEPGNNSVCRLNHIGAASTASSQNVTACIRQAGAGVRESVRIAFMANTAGSKTQSEDASGSANGTTVSCLQTREAGGTQIATKRIKATTIITEQINCLRDLHGRRSPTSTPTASTPPSTASCSRASIRTPRSSRRPRRT